MNSALRNILRATCLTTSLISAIPASAKESSASKVLVGHVCATSPTGMAIVINDSAAFVLEPQYSDRPQDDAQVAPGTTAPDGSYLQTHFTHQGARVTLTWGKSGKQAFIATLTSDKPVELGLRTKRYWGDFPSSWWSVPGGLDGYLVNGAEGYLSASMRTDPAPSRYEGNYAGEVTIFVHLSPDRPLRVTAGLGELPGFDTIAGALAKAEETYQKSRISATGDWGGFVDAIADNMNYSRTYSSFDHRSAHIVGRGWWIYKNNNNNPDFGPYFCWDQFFNGNLAVLEDPQGSRETIRGVLAYQLPDGFIANCGRWDYPDDGVRNFCSADRSQPPVGALSVWNMHERWPDKSFLAEVYPKLLRWHHWWHKNRDGNQNGLLEWGSAKGKFEMARLETGLDDTPHYDGSPMSGSQMACDSVDLNALWSMDVLYLAKIAKALGKEQDARRLIAAHEKINRLINERLWNEEMGLYCSRLWQDQPNGQPAFLTRITPANFYPLACHAPDQARADRALQFLYRPEKFWGEWLLPTVTYDDPEWSKQHYWKGQVWAPTNWLVWQGVKRYADATHRAEFARRGIRLFMKNWNESRQCCENYRSNTGKCGDNPHYTWGALLNLIGVEALCGIDENFSPVPYEDSGISENLTLRNIPFGGKLYRIEAKNGKVTATKESSR